MELGSYRSSFLSCGRPNNVASLMDQQKVIDVTTVCSVVFGGGFDVDPQDGLRSTCSSGGSPKVCPEGV